MSKEKNAPTPQTGWQLSDTQIVSCVQSSTQFAQAIQNVKQQRVTHPVADARHIELFVRRDDRLHPYLSGNKLYKLFGHIRHWHSCELHRGKTVLCSFGGAFSNHLYALAAYGKLSGHSTLGVIRGERPSKLNSTLTALKTMGMRLIFVSRETYQRRGQVDIMRDIEHSANVHNRCYWIPEGGAGEYGQEGCLSLGNLIAKQGYDAVALACGTGTTYLGLLNAFARAAQDMPNRHLPKLIGISALRNNFELVKKVFSKTNALSRNDNRPSTSNIISNQYHFGGFAKTNQSLSKFIDEFHSQTNIETEPVYTGKLMYAVVDMIEKNIISEGSRVLVLHSGGLRTA